MLIFEKSRPGRGCSAIPACDVEQYTLPDDDMRESDLHLPEMAEVDLSRHYTELAKKAHGVNDGFYPLGSCTMKYNPKVNEQMAALDGFTQIHPLQPVETVQGCLQILKETEDALSAITGMSNFTLQPAAGAHGRAALRHRRHQRAEGGGGGRRVWRDECRRRRRDAEKAAHARRPARPH